MTALGARDGERRDYADIAAAMRDLSRSPRADQRKLFQRVVASVVLGNTDDHLRNHGFLADRGFWTLSPAFDVNPNPDPWRARATSVMGAEAIPEEAEALLPFAEECSLTLEHAGERMRALVEALDAWRESARSHGIDEREITLMAESIEPRREAVLKVARTRA
ncbi:HipA domain-containing protein [Humibacter sp. BT305]|nr:HipA domain-containing protein [Humibacter sp. BT305]